MTTRFTSALKPVTLAVAAFIVAGCSSLNPTPLEDKAVRDRASADRVKMFDQQEPITAAITLDEAIARALKYNLDLRLKKMEVAVNGQLHEVSKYDMLPNLVVGAGYMDRNNYSGGTSASFLNPTVKGATPDRIQTPGGSYTTSADMSHRLRSAEFSWNVLDFGVSYYRAKQRADEFLIAQERKRRVIQTTVHDVRYAYLRALAAQKLAGEAETVMKQSVQAIEQSRAAESRGAIPVQTALAYKRTGRRSGPAQHPPPRAGLCQGRAGRADVRAHHPVHAGRHARAATQSAAHQPGRARRHRPHEPPRAARGRPQKAHLCRRNPSPADA